MGGRAGAGVGQREVALEGGQAAVAAAPADQALGEAGPRAADRLHRHDQPGPAPNASDISSTGIGPSR